MNYRRVLITLSVIAIVICIGLFAVDKYHDKKARETIETIQEISRKGIKDEPDGYTSPINFSELKKINTDIYAWMVIKGTNVDLPVLRRKDDNSYYMNRDITERYSGGGSLYSENYNQATFDDKVTIVYGHNMRDGSMLGEMRNYSKEEYFSKNNHMTIYLPQSEKHYELVGAIPFDNRHIMLSYDFSKKRDFESLVYELLNVRNLNARYAQDAHIDKNDRIVILSTCYFGRRDMRYLIIWKEITKQ